MDTPRKGIFNSAIKNKFNKCGQNKVGMMHLSKEHDRLKVTRLVMELLQMYQLIFMSTPVCVATNYPLLPS